MAPASLSSGFQSFTPVPTIKLGPSGAGSPVGGLVHTLGPCGSLQRPLLRGWQSLLLLPQPPRALSIRGLRLYFPELEPWVAQSASLPAVRQVYLWANVVLRGATRCSACPVLRHSESGPLGLSAQMWGRRVCQCLDCLRHLSHTPPVSVPPQPRESSPPRCQSPPLLPVWMNVYFLFPWCWSPLLFDSLSVLVVRGGAVCLPTPPSWFLRFF